MLFELRIIIKFSSPLCQNYEIKFNWIFERSSFRTRFVTMSQRPSGAFLFKTESCWDTQKFVQMPKPKSCSITTPNIKNLTIISVHTWEATHTITSSIDGFIIALSWRRFLATRSPSWPIYTWSLSSHACIAEMIQNHSKTNHQFVMYNCTW